MDQLAIAVLTTLGVILALGVPIAFVCALFWVARRRLSGRHGRLDGLFTGAARANAMNSHLQAATPHPDELANPLRPRRLASRRKRRR